jgi:hypothetical protein
MAQKSGLMPTKDKFAAEKKNILAKRLNCYWDEKTIDIQWNERTKRSQRRDFFKTS